MNSLETSWIAESVPVPAAELAGFDDEADEIGWLLERGFVRIETSPSGTIVSWSVASANWARLYALRAVLKAYPGPYRLSYFVAGWFTEEPLDLAAADARIAAIMAKSDVWLPRRVFVREADPARPDMPPLLRRALSESALMPECRVDMSYDAERREFAVTRIGERSTIARVYGLNPVAYPCQSGNSYDHVVSAAYHAVLESGRPRYDHVLAAMTAPDSRIVWFPYQRVILPRRADAAGRPGVAVVAELAPVDIRLI